MPRSGLVLPTFAATNDLSGILADDHQAIVDKRGRSKPRIPGGSGCDDPGDIIEHPECRG